MVIISITISSIILFHYDYKYYYFFIILFHYYYEAARTAAELRGAIGEGPNGVGANGVTADFMFFDRGTFVGANLSKSVKIAYLFAQSVESRYFRGDPVSADPICPRTYIYI